MADEDSAPSFVPPRAPSPSGASRSSDVLGGKSSSVPLCVPRGSQPPMPSRSLTPTPVSACGCAPPPRIRQSSHGDFAGAPACGVRRGDGPHRVVRGRPRRGLPSPGQRALPGVPPLRARDVRPDGDFVRAVDDWQRTLGWFPCKRKEWIFARGFISSTRGPFGCSRRRAGRRSLRRPRRDAPARRPSR